MTDILKRLRAEGEANPGAHGGRMVSIESILSELQPQLTARYQVAMAAILSRLDLVLGYLRGATDLAHGDLDVAWQLLLRVLSGTGAEVRLALTAT